MSLQLIAEEEAPDMPDGAGLLQAQPFAAYTTDPEGRITAFNDAAVELWGRRPRLDVWSGSFRLFSAEGQPMAHDQCPLAQLLKTGLSPPADGMIVERPDGSRVRVMPYPAILRDSQGRVTGAFNMVLDIEARLETDSANRHFGAIVESSDDAIISKGLDGVIRSWNASAERIFGYRAQEAVGQHVSILIPDERLDEEPGIIERIRGGERIHHYETVRRHKDGTAIDISLSVSPIKDAAGKVVGAAKIARDITERKRAERAHEMLMNEVKHRVKNTLGTVQAIASQTFRAGPRAERDAFGQRLRALSNAHDLLTRQNWDKVSLRDMIQRAIAPFAEPRTGRVRAEGPDTEINANQALQLAMMMHELASNAVKFGALSNDTGTVTLEWRIDAGSEGRTLEMEWRERGGPPVCAPDAKGFGTTMVGRSSGETGCFEFHSDGLVCRPRIAI